MVVGDFLSQQQAPDRGIPRGLYLFLFFHFFPRVGVVRQGGEDFKTLGGGILGPGSGPGLLGWRGLGRGGCSGRTLFPGKKNKKPRRHWGLGGREKNKKKGPGGASGEPCEEGKFIPPRGGRKRYYLNI